VVDEGWYICEGNQVQLTDRDAVPLPGEGNRRTLGPDETSREGAARRAAAASEIAEPAKQVLPPPAALSESWFHMK
jgi:hypothetical protein